MRNLPLSHYLVNRLKLRNSTYDIRDTDIKSFGIRLLPSGKKGELYTRVDGGQLAR